MSKAARKAFLAAKQTKAMEKLDKMIEELHEAGLPISAAVALDTAMDVTRTGCTQMPAGFCRGSTRQHRHIIHIM